MAETGTKLIFVILRLSLAFLVIKQCKGISLDYLEERKASTDVYTRIEDGRRIGDDEVSIKTYEYKNSDEAQSTRHSTQGTQNTSKAGDLRHLASDIAKGNIRQQVTTQKAPINDDYEETFPAPDYYGEFRSDLRQDIKVDGYANFAGSKNEIPMDEMPYNALKLNADLFNVVPAISDFQVRDGPFANNNGSSQWYVMERRPCWNLPIIYGELGKIFKGATAKHEVFGLYSSLMKNVIDNHLPNEVKIKDEPFSRFESKWCAVPPCYGDHTLCLFPDPRAYSTLCGKDYKAKRPTSLERIRITNIINSIRNHVAKGSPDEYPYLPPAANMKQIMYDGDLESMAIRWLRQCLPGPAPCAALNLNFVTHLECRKFSDKCCRSKISPMFLGDSEKTCTPNPDCYVNPYVGCIYTWFWSAGNDLDFTDVKCGFIKHNTYHLAQLLWSETNKVGCASGHHSVSGDTRVVCAFAPGAPFFIDTKYYCGLLNYPPYRVIKPDILDMTDLDYLNYNGFWLREMPERAEENHLEPLGRSQQSAMLLPDPNNTWGVVGLSARYQQHWARTELDDWDNGTMSMTARLTTLYNFHEETNARCDSDRPIYEVGLPGAKCLETGHKFHALCYQFRDPYPEYRLVAVLAPMAIFALLLFDLFSGVVRQANY